MTEDETRGRKKKELDEEVLTDIIRGFDQLPTTQQVRKEYNSRMDTNIAWETVSNNLVDNDEFEGLQISDRTGWELKEELY